MAAVALHEGRLHWPQQMPFVREGCARRIPLIVIHLHGKCSVGTDDTAGQRTAKKNKETSEEFRTPCLRDARRSCFPSFARAHIVHTSETHFCVTQLTASWVLQFWPRKEGRLRGSIPTGHRGCTCHATRRCRRAVNQHTPVPRVLPGMRGVWLIHADSGPQGIARGAE